MFLKKQKYFVVFSPSTRFVALDLITEPLTLFCLSSVSFSLRFSNFSILFLVTFCSNFCISSANCLSFLSFFYFCVEKEMVCPLTSINDVDRKS